MTSDRQGCLIYLVFLFAAVMLFVFEGGTLYDNKISYTTVVVLALASAALYLFVWPVARAIWWLLLGSTIINGVIYFTRPNPLTDPRGYEIALKLGLAYAPRGLTVTLAILVILILIALWLRANERKARQRLITYLQQSDQPSIVLTLREIGTIIWPPIWEPSTWSVAQRWALLQFPETSSWPTSYDGWTVKWVDWTDAWGTPDYAGKLSFTRDKRTST